MGEGAGRSGVFNEAKRQSGVPVSQNPSKVLPNIDKRGNLQPGRIYQFEVPTSNGKTRTIEIREDPKGIFMVLEIHKIVDHILVMKQKPL